MKFSLIAGMIHLFLCTSFSTYINNRLDKILIDPSKPVDYWLAAGTASQMPVVPSNGMANLPSGNIGWFEYTFEVASSGWCRLVLDGTPNLDRVELEIDAMERRDPEHMAESGSLVPGDWVWLSAGSHRLRIIKNFWTGLPKISAIRLEAPMQGQSGAFRVITEKDPWPVTALGRCHPLRILTGGFDRKSQIEFLFQSKARLLRRIMMAVPASAAPQVRELAIPCDVPGDVNLDIAMPAQPSQAHLQVTRAYSVMDTKPVQSVIHQERVAYEINAVTSEPEFGSGESVIRKGGAAGAYRESGDKGATRFVRGQSKEESDWFAYRVVGLQPGHPYIFEVEYPDDAERVFVAAFRDSKTVSYPVSLGMETGGVWLTSGKIASRSAVIWPQSSDARVIIYNMHDGKRAAVSRIRFYEASFRNELAEPVLQNGREIVAYSEEGANFRALVGKDSEPESVEEAVTRYFRLARLMGATTISPTVLVYNFELYPSKFNLTFQDRDSDLTSAFLFGAERFGMKVVPELHPRADELAWPPRTPEAFQKRLLMSKTGETFYNGPGGSPHRPPFYNALDPDVARWYLDVVGELADRYKAFRSFAGIQLRLSDWQNPALNNLVSLDWGYNIGTTDRFFHETGLADPMGLSFNSDRFIAAQQRAAVLTGQYRDVWVRWRCEKIRDVLQAIVARVRHARPDLVVRLSFFALEQKGAASRNRESLREAGIDLNMLSGIEGLVLVDGRFQHGAKEASAVWQRQTRDAHLSPEGVSLFGNHDVRPSAMFPMHYLEIPPNKLATSAKLGWPKAANEPWVSAASEPPGRLRLARYAELVGLDDVYMLGDGGNGYVFSGDGLNEFMTEFCTLPREAFTRVSTLSNVALWRRADMFYIVNLSAEHLTERIAFGGIETIERITTGEKITTSALDVTLKPYELRVFRKENNGQNFSLQLQSLTEKSGHPQ